MQPGELHLIQYRQVSWQRAHFAIYVHQSSCSAAQADTGTLINVIGNPVNGFVHEIRTSYDLAQEKRKYETTYLTTINLSQLDAMIQVAHSIEPPRRSENFMAPVDGVKNRRCQEWTMEYVHALVKEGLVDEDVVRMAQSKRDPPDHGVGLRQAFHQS